MLRRPSTPARRALWAVIRRKRLIKLRQLGLADAQLLSARPELVGYSVFRLSLAEITRLGEFIQRSLH